MEFNKKGFNEFRKDLKEALRAVEEKHNVEIELGNLAYSEYSFDINLLVTRNCENMSGKQLEFNRLCYLYGFKPEDYDKPFRLNGKTFTLIGFSTRSPKNCCKIYCKEDGITYRCSAEAALRALSK